MSNCTWIGASEANQQVQTITIGTYDATTTYTVTIGNNSVSLLGSGGTAAAFAAILQAALSASVATEFADAQWSYPGSGSIVTGTGTYFGKPFTVTVSVSGGSGSISTSITTASQSPNDAANPINWSPRLPQGACSSPVQANASATSGGSLSNGTTYYWVITALNGNGETTKSNEKSLAITNPNNSAVLSWAAVTSATGYNIYRTTTSGTYTSPALVATVGAVTTYTDTGTATTTGAPPVSNTAVADNIIFENSTIPCLYNCQTFANANFSLVTVQNTFAPATPTAIGLPTTNKAGYVEYRQCNLQFASLTTLSVNQAQNLPIASLKFDVGAGACAATISGPGNNVSIGNEVVWLKGSSTSNALTVDGGSVALGALSTDVAAVSTLTATSGATVNCGASATFNGVAAVINQSTFQFQNNLTSLTMNGQSACTRVGTATLGTLTINGPSPGVFADLSNGTITNCTSAGTIDNSQDSRTRTYSNSVTFIPGATFYDPAGSANRGGTFTFTVNGGLPTQCNLVLGPGRSWAVT